MQLPFQWVTARLSAPAPHVTCGHLHFSTYKPEVSFSTLTDEPPRIAGWGGTADLRSWSIRLEERRLDEAVIILDHLVERGIFADSSVLYGLIKRCIVEQDLVSGARIHALVVKSGQESDVFLANHVLRMYASQGRLEEATSVFTKVYTPDCHMWASIISAHATHEQPREALRLYRQMRGSCVKPDDHVFVAVLKACASAKQLSSGREVHADIVAAADKVNVFVGTSLVNMYAKCLSLEEARQVFEHLPSKNVATWNAMMAGYTHNGLGRQALDLYARMQDEKNISANRITYLCALQACGSIGDLNEGKRLETCINNSHLDADAVVSTCLVDMYAKCGSLENASRVFNSLPTKDVVSWTAMIAGYAQHGLGREARSLYASMHHADIKPTSAVTFVYLLQACADIGALEEGKQLHAQIQERGLGSDRHVSNGLVNMYAKCGSLGDARKVFDSLATRDVMTWNVMIAGHLHHGFAQEALILYERMCQERIAPADAITFVCLLQACGSIKALYQGQQLHAQILESGLEADLDVGTSLLDMYMKCGNSEDARKVFDNLPNKNLVTWTAMISGYSQCGLGHAALAVYAEMQLEDVTTGDNILFASVLQACASIGNLQQGMQIHAQISELGLEFDGVVGSALVDMYAKCDSIEDACRVFDRLPTKNVVTWNSMIAGHLQHGLDQKALDLYAAFLQDGSIAANHGTFASVLQACISIGALHQGRLVHAHICDRGLEEEEVLGCSLVKLYSKCGSLKDAREVFDKLPNKDVVTWTAMIAGYAQSGLGQEALALYGSMESDGQTPADAVTFSCLLPACASMGALQQGRQLHKQIQERGLEGDLMVGNSLVDMYAKCGRMTDARTVFDRLPTRDVVTWNALLTGYAEHNDGSMAMQCFHDMLQQGVEPDDTTFLCLLVACSHAGLVDEGHKYFAMMLDDGVVPTLRHRNCMVDLLGRSGRLKEAVAIMQTMPFRNNVVGWTSLLSACKSYGDVELGRTCFNHLIELDPQNAVGYVLLGGIYANGGEWRKVKDIETQRKAAGAWKKPAKACIEVKRKVHEFIVGGERSDIATKLRNVNAKLQEQGGHVPQTNLVLQAISEQEKEDVLCGHAEKLALAYGLMNTPDGTSLLVTKNLRMCNDCHNSTKIMSNIEKREITVRDAHRVHRFVNGSCSCGDRH